MQFTPPPLLWDWEPLSLHHPAHCVHLVHPEHGRQPRDGGGIESHGTVQAQLEPSLLGLVVQLLDPLCYTQVRRLLGITGMD